MKLEKTVFFGNTLYVSEHFASFGTKNPIWREVGKVCMSFSIGITLSIENYTIEYSISLKKIGLFR